MFYLKTSLEDNLYVITNGCDTNNKNKAAIFSFIEGNFELPLKKYLKK